MNTSSGPGEGSHRHILGRGLGTFSITAGEVMKARTGHLTWTGPFNGLRRPNEAAAIGKTPGRQEPGTDASGRDCDTGVPVGRPMLEGDLLERRLVCFPDVCPEAVSRNDFIQGICREPSSWRSDAVSLSAPVP